MKRTVVAIFAIFLIVIVCILPACDSSLKTDETTAVKKTGAPSGNVTWDIDNTVSIGGHPLTVLGAPEVIEIPGGKAVAFDGVGDGLLVDVHPLEGATAFTLEVIFRPDADGLPEQRFFHLQEDNGQNRILIETRLTGDGFWYLDTFIKSGDTDQTLAEKDKIHPVGEWYNATLVFDGGEMRHYVNGVLETAATLPSFTPPEAGKTSIGVRINQVHWFKGAIRRARFTRMALEPEAFLNPSP